MKRKEIFLLIVFFFVLIIIGYFSAGLLTLSEKAVKVPLIASSPKIMVNDSVPQLISDALARANSEVKIVTTEAGTQLVISQQPTSLQWVLAPVVSFPTLSDNIAWKDIRSFWQEGSSSLNYLSEGQGTPTLFCSQETAGELTMLLGQPSPKAPLKIVSPGEIVDAVWRARPASWAIVPFGQLTPRLKVLRLDGVDVLEKGLVKKEYPLQIYFSLQGEGADRFTLPRFTNRSEEKMTVLVMTGVTALVRATAMQMERNGVLYPSRYVGSILRSADIAHISNEVPFAKDCPFPNANQETLTFCSDPRYIELLADVGTDVVELTGNHFEDYGPEATRETVAMYDQRGWGHYGGGSDLADAQRPLTMIDHDNSVSFMGCNPVGPAYAWAKENYPGAAPCDFDYIYKTLGQLKEKVNVPIFTWQYEEIYQYPPTPQQRQDFRAVVDAGAKIVSGSQSHHPQAIEFYQDGFIHYGLGNLFFDQMDDLGTRQECADRHIIYNGRHISTELLTFMLEDYAQPRPMTTEERRALLQSLFSASGW